MDKRRQAIIDNKDLSEVEMLKQLCEFDFERPPKRRKPTNIFPKKKKRKK